MADNKDEGSSMSELKMQSLNTFGFDPETWARLAKLYGHGEFEVIAALLDPEQQDRWEVILEALRRADQERYHHG
jgi:hypothetical protein